MVAFILFTGSTLFRYAYSRDWADMATTLRLSTQDSACDEMVQLCHESKTLRVIPSVRKIVYSNVKDIAFHLRNPHLPLKSTLRADAMPFKPAARPTPLSTDNTKDTNDGVAHESVTESNSSLEEEPDDPAVPNLPNEEAHEDKALEADASSEFVDIPQSIDLASAPPSDKELQAAQLIKDTYKRILSRRNGAAKRGLAASRAAIYDVCYAETQKMDWPNRTYRLLFLGPLVHALLCLDVVHADVALLKKGIKKRIHADAYQELEELSKKQTELTSVH